MPRSRPRTFDEVVAAQSPEERLRWQRSETFKDPTVRESHADVTVIESHQIPGEWHVEYFGDDGECYVNVFSGPEAERRARQYFKALKDRTLKTIRMGETTH